MEKREREWRKRRGRRSEEVAGVRIGFGVVRRRSEEREWRV